MGYISTERVAEIRKELKEALPNFKFSVTKDGYSGVVIDVLAGDVNMEFEGSLSYSVNVYWIDDHFKEYPDIIKVLKTIYKIASKGTTWTETGDYGNQPSHYTYIQVGRKSPYVYTPKVGLTPKIGGNKTRRATWDKGTLLKECGGWKVYQRTLPDGRVIYSAFKDKETAPNKTDWNLIKGEIYTETGFKWGRFGNFEKWGSVEDSQLDKLCSILTKYYGGGKQEEKPNDDDLTTRFLKYVKSFYDNKFTDEEIGKAYGEYMSEIALGRTDWTWGGGDSTDRERIYNIMSWNRAEKKDDITPSKEDVEKQIKALRYLAEAGDDEAQKQINALKYLLN